MAKPKEKNRVKEFRYKALGKKGQIYIGTLVKPDIKQVNAHIKAMRLKPVEVLDKSKGGLSSFFDFDEKGRKVMQIMSAKPKLKELAVFTKQFAILMDRGVPVVQSLEILAKQQKNPRFGGSLAAVKQMVEEGSSVSQAMRAYPKIFDRLFISIIESGEISGKLDHSLKEIHRLIEKTQKIRKQLISASMYPGITLVVSMALTFGILNFLVPHFAGQFEANGRELPFLTKVIVDASDFMQANIFYIVGAIVAIVVGIKHALTIPKYQKLLEENLFKLPVFGDAFRKIAVVRFCSSLATMLTSGVSLVDALTIVANTSSSEVLRESTEKIKYDVSQGLDLSDSIARIPLFPSMLVSMIAVGEQTGSIDETLQKTAEIYEDEVDSAINAASNLLQPLMIVGVGGMLGTVVIALYLPILEQASNAMG